MACAPHGGHPLHMRCPTCCPHAGPCATHTLQETAYVNPANETGKQALRDYEKWARQIKDKTPPKFAIYVEITPLPHPPPTPPPRVLPEWRHKGFTGARACFSWPQVSASLSHSACVPR